MATEEKRPRGRPKSPPRPPRRPNEPLADPVRERYAGQRAMGLSQAAALRQADPRAAHRKDASNEQMASRIERDPDVRARTKEIVGDLLKSSDAYLTKAALAELITDEIRTMAREPGGLTAAASLVDKYCKMFGFYEAEKREVRLGCVDEDAQNEKIAKLLGKSRT